jgi:hypothetical protein
LIIPTGNSQYGLGAGAWGGQFNMAVTKRLSPKVTSHWNAGLTHFTKADYYTYDTEGKPSLLYQKNLGMKNLGASFIWMVKPKFNLMLELVKNYEQEISETGSVDKKQGAIINPGFRFAVDIGKVQIVPGLGVPFNFENGRYTNTGAFIYLSIEPAY